MSCAECGAQVGAVAEVCERCGAPVIVVPLVPAFTQSAFPADGALTATARRGDVITRPSVRRGMALAGASTALLSGVAGIIAFALFDTRYPNPVSALLVLAAYAVPAAVAVAALGRIDRLVIAGLLQGMSWPAVAYVAEDLVNPSVHHLLSYTGRTLAALSASLSSDVLGAAAAVLLVISWSQAVGTRRGWRPGSLPVALLCAVALAQFAVLIFWITLIQPAAEGYALGIVELLAGLAVTWYGVTLRDTTLGGILVLGWATGAALPVLGFVLELRSGTPAIAGTIGSVLLCAVAALALIHSKVLKRGHRI